MVALDEYFHHNGTKTRSRCCTTSISPGFRNRPLLIDHCSLIIKRSADAYGSTLIFTGPGADGLWFTDDDAQSDYGANEIIFCGYRYDPESQLYYVRNRTYNPVLGRWIQRDPIGYAGGINLYEYVGGSAVGALDDLGTSKLSFTLIGPYLGIDKLFAPRILHTVIADRNDLLDIWKRIKTKVGKFDPSGKCGNCVRVLDLFAHGQHSREAIHDTNRYLTVAKGENLQKPPRQRRCSVANIVLKNVLTLGSLTASGGKLDPASVQFFKDITSLGCKGGATVRFIGCNTATGHPGDVMLQGVHAITGSPVYGYAGDIYPPFEVFGNLVSVP